jgi:3-phenylpropionate/trans-cinnamate dioxygenase ferredoxin reductase component
MMRAAMRGSWDVVIVGAGHAGAQAAISLRASRFVGSILMIGAESELPYDRPQLSKAYLLGETSIERIRLRSASFWAERLVDTLLGRLVEEVRADSHTLRLDDSTHVSYGTLIWAAGGSPRPLPWRGAHLNGVHCLRSKLDADGIREGLRDARKLVIVGGGYVGLESAAVARSLDKSVVLLESQSRLLSRVAGSQLSEFMEREHSGQGVQVHVGAQVADIEGEAGRVRRVVLQDGRAFEADLVIVGIGIVPNTRALLAAGADGGNGVLVDERCRTTLPNVYAIGDCALHANSFASGQLIRLESVQNAYDQATVAARNIAGIVDTYSRVPTFWSTQFDIKLQSAGIAAGYDEVTVSAQTESRSFCVTYMRQGEAVAIDCVNSTREFLAGKKLLSLQRNEQTS